MRHFLYSVLLFAATVPVFVYGQETKVYSPLIIVKNAGSEITNFSDYIGFLYGMSISLAALLAVIKIIIAGTKYMVSDIVSSKGDAIADIQGAILGLLLILGAVIILEFINPQLVKRDIKFDSIGPRPGLNTSVKTASGLSSSQLAEVLTTGLNPCLAKSDNTGGANKTVVVVGVSVVGCTAADKPAEILAEVRNRCKAQGGYIYNSPDRTTVGCGVPGVVVEKFTINEYSSASNACLLGVGMDPTRTSCIEVVLSSKYLSQNGRLVTYNAAEFCKKEYPMMSASACEEEVRDAFFESDDWGSLQDSYCQNNAGKRQGSFGCVLPSKTISYDEAVAIQAKVTPGAIIINQQLFENICTEQLGNTAKLIDTKRTWVEGSRDYTCAIY